VNIKLHPYQLEFVFPFRIAHGVRTHTDALFVELESDGIIAFGEATFPPYLLYTSAAAIEGLSQIELRTTNEKIDPKTIVSQQTGLEPPALAALDMAVWTLKAKLENTSVRSLLGIAKTFSPPRSYTISVCDREEMAKRLDHGISKGFSFFKLKLNGTDDARMLSDFRSLTKASFAVDANQAWTDMGYALEFSKELQHQGCVLIEQPFHKSDLVNTQKLSSELSIPIIADEACQTISDINKVKGVFGGVNIKLQKCGGITPAFEMINYAKSLGLKVLIGCMSESAIGCGAAEVLSPLCDWNDLDGSYLVKEVPFGNQ
jgi:L-alanine-DL-glutamate epimerase-like enolase superfamily enzyme